MENHCIHKDGQRKLAHTPVKLLQRSFFENQRESQKMLFA